MPCTHPDVGTPVEAQGPPTKVQGPSAEAQGPQKRHRFPSSLCPPWLSPDTYLEALWGPCSPRVPGRSLWLPGWVTPGFWGGHLATPRQWEGWYGHLRVAGGTLEISGSAHRELLWRRPRGCWGALGLSRGNRGSCGQTWRCWWARWGWSCLGVSWGARWACREGNMVLSGSPGRWAVPEAVPP